MWDHNLVITVACFSMSCSCVEFSSRLWLAAGNNKRRWFVSSSFTSHSDGAILLSCWFALLTYCICAGIPPDSVVSDVVTC